MNDDLKELGITHDEDMEEGVQPGEVVDDKVATGEVGDNDPDEAGADVSMEEAQKIEEEAEKKRLEEEE